MTNWPPQQPPRDGEQGSFFQGQPGFAPQRNPYQQPGMEADEQDYFAPADPRMPRQAPATQPNPYQRPPQQTDPFQAPAPPSEDDQGFFTPAGPQALRQAPAPPQHAMPPVYEGELNNPAPVDPFAAFPQYPLTPGGTGSHVPPGNQPPPGQELPERIPYQAPPRQRNMMIYLYIGLGILVAVLGAMGINQLLNNKAPRTAIVTIAEQESAQAGNAIIVRDETVFMQEGVSDILYIAEENATVNRGDPVCTVYTTGFSSRELTQLQTYRRQIKEYLKILTGTTDAPDTKLQLLDTTIFDRAVETRALVQGTHGNLLNQESLLKEAISSRYTYMKQKYPDDTKLTRLYDNENNQLQRIDTWTKQYAATDNGIVSFYTDGFEGALNISNYTQYDPQQVRTMYNGTVPQVFERPKNSLDIYRLVRPYEWAVLMLANNLQWNPVVGEVYQMMIESFDNTTVEAKVESVTRSGGDLLVRLTVNSSVKPVLNIRSCHVQLSTSRITYAVPLSALVPKEGLIGVVVTFREGTFIVPVDVVSQDATQAYVVPLNAGHLYEGLSVQLFPGQ